MIKIVTLSVVLWGISFALLAGCGSPPPPVVQRSNTGDLRPPQTGSRIVRGTEAASDSAQAREQALRENDLVRGGFR